MKETVFVQPDVVPVGFDFDGEYFFVGGMNLAKSTKSKTFRVDIVRLQSSLTT